MAHRVNVLSAFDLASLLYDGISTMKRTINSHWLVWLACLGSPINHISRQTPPLMLIFGGADTQVSDETADHYVAKLGRAGLNDVSYHRLGTLVSTQVPKGRRSKAGGASPRNRGSHAIKAA